MGWIYLLLAGFFEIGWPVGLKIAQKPASTVLGIAIAAVCIVISGYLLWMAQRTIPIGTAYAIWTGIGAVGTFGIGILLFGDTLSLARIGAVFLILAGVVGLKLAEG